MKYSFSKIRLHRANRMVWIASVITGILIIWSSVSKVDEVTHSKGVVIARARTQIIQSAVDGVIQEIAVEEGQTVKKGQILARLERTQAEAAENDSSGKVAALEATLVRLHAEVLGSPLVFPENVKAFPHFITNQTQLYLRRKSALDSEIGILKENLRLVQAELDLTQPLVASGDVGKIEVIRLQRQVAELKGQISFRRNKFFQDAQQEMTKAEEELSTQKQIRAERTFNVEKLEVRSPADGLVKKIQITTPGAKVRPGEVLMELLPTDSSLIVEGKLRTSDIGFVRPGMAATVKLDAFDYSIYGVLKGAVSYISPDAITEQTPQGELLFYRVQIRLADVDSQHRHGRALKIQPGMTVGIDIRTGRKSVLSYLTKPVVKVFNESMSER
jgi:multidrug efflux pump subunit AcrA (membrane-fusion protein)